MNTATNARRTPSSAAVFEEIWPQIAGSVAAAFRMDQEERSRLEGKRIATLIGAIPFLAGCEQPARTAVTHVGTYLLSIKDTKAFFNADASDDVDVFERLRLIMNFRGGDQRIIDKGMSLLALSMIDDYKRDIHIDETFGKYNPVAAGAFDYESTREGLVRRIEAVDCPPMDEILDSGMGTEGYWAP
jgi:hypothetical protein